MVSKTAKIIIFEDDPDLAQIIKDWLNKGGWVDVATQSESKNWREHLSSTKPNIIITDLHLEAKYAGINIINKANQDENKCIAKTILISSERQVAKIASEINADGYLEKPFNLQQLSDLVLNDA